MIASALVLLVGPASAQTPAQAPAESSAPAPLLGIFSKYTQWRFEQVSPTHLRLTGEVEIEGDQISFAADEVDLYTDTNRLVARGNVVFASAEGRIAADEVDYNTEKGTGVFRQASGILSLGPTADRLPFGDQDPDVYFYGQQLEKIAAREYRVTNGGFTTCVQPTPRWEVTSGSVMLRLDEYAFARNTILRVKGVPVFYLPVMYYPIQEDERATGFLLPSYGSSTVRGQAISNAFFWAIDRSQDATFFHDWFSRGGQGAGAEYRYVAGPQSRGNVRLYRFARQESTYTDNGTTNTLPASTSFEMTGTASQALGRTTRAHLRLEYFTDIITQQLYHQDLYQATRRNRTIESGLNTVRGPLAASALFQRHETFSSATQSLVYGGTPRLTANLAPQRLGRTPVYGSISTEYAYLPYRSIEDGEVKLDKSLNRADATPTLRVPLSRLTYLSVNSSASYRTTFYSKSFDATGRVVPESFLRQYLALRTEVVGPVFTRIWDTPDSGFAERLKHVIEPTFAVDYTTNFESATRTPLLSDSSDFVVAGASRYTYGLNNRFFYRGRTVDEVRGQTREFITIGLQQTYYSNRQSSQYDTGYSSASTSRSQVDLSPIALNGRVAPNSAIDGTVRAEYDVSGGGLQVLTIGTSVNLDRARSSVNYSRRHLTRTAEPDNYVSTTTSFRMRGGRVTTAHSLSWSITQGYLVSQSVQLSYLAQCCGIQMEFQNYNFPTSSGYPVPSDRRFNMSFVLAGLGTFSNFFGAFGGTSR
ncbi:MAG: putative LPS assembly protein LptD [Vicinamibacterales bacterium]